jgi:hypothetical protein
MFCNSWEAGRPEYRWPGSQDDDTIANDSWIDLVFHYVPDAEAWLGKIERSFSSEHIAAAPATLRRREAVAASTLRLKEGVFQADRAATPNHRTPSPSASFRDSRPG